MDVKIVSKPAFTVVGPKYHGDNANEEIPKMWGQSGPLFEAIQHKSEECICYGVCDNYDKESNVFDYIAAVAVSNADDIPEGTVRWEIPEQTYAAFECTLPTLGEVFKHAYEVWLPQSGYERACGPEFELYDKDFEVKDPGSKMYIYIPIEKKA